MKNENRKRVASGVYLAVVENKKLREKTLKFAIIQGAKLKKVNFTEVKLLKRKIILERYVSLNIFD